MIKIDMTEEPEDEDDLIFKAQNIYIEMVSYVMWYQLKLMNMIHFILDQIIMNILNQIILNIYLTKLIICDILYL